MQTVKNKLNKINTSYIVANLRKCTACWRCVEACPKQVIGKVGFLWHKHIVIKNADSCSGCKRCIRICQCEVFSENTYKVF